MASRRSAGKGAAPAAGIVFRTHLGWVAAAARRGRVIAVSLPAPTAEAARGEVPADAPFGRPNGVLLGLAEDLKRYFAGDPVDLRGHPVDLSGLPRFFRRALLAARGIPYGKTRSYAWVAARAGAPAAVRAAGQAMARNPVPLVVPCHRVLGAAGALTGFGGGLAMKRALLELEGVRCEGARLLPRLRAGRAAPEKREKSGS